MWYLQRPVSGDISMPKLTKRLVESTQPEARDFIVWDDELPGFGLRVWPSGKRVYILKYRTANGRQRKPLLGMHGAITVDEARNKARLWLAEAAKGGDPSGERQDGRRAPSFAEFSDRYMTEYARPKNKPSTLRETRRMLDRILLPSFGALKLADIQRPDVARLNHKLHETPYMANRALALLSNMLNVAERWALRPDYSNPCRHIQRAKEKRRERYLSEAELARLGAALLKAEQIQSELPSAIAAIRLLIFTGARASEILTLRWDAVNWEKKCLQLADSKTGPKPIYLNAPASEVLSKIHPVPGNPYVITGGKEGDHLKDLEKPWQRIRGLAEIVDVRLHDLRHSFASIAVSGGMSLPMIGGLLGHRNTATTARYAHLAADPLRQANDIIGERLAAAMRHKKAEVIGLPRRSA